jgi:hypothetical protein
LSLIKIITEIIMALGDLLFEEKGKQLSARTVDSIEPTAEISGMGSLRYKDENISTHWTISVKIGQNGVSHAQGRGIMYAENNEVATYSINGIGKPKSSGGGSSSRGVSMFHSNLSSSSSNGKLSSLNDIVTVYELEQDNEGNYTAKAWEWK